MGYQRNKRIYQKSKATDLFAVFRLPRSLFSGSSRPFFSKGDGFPCPGLFFGFGYVGLRGRLGLSYNIIQKELAVFDSSEVS